jgi:hypothetical protein
MTTTDDPPRWFVVGWVAVYLRWRLALAAWDFGMALAEPVVSLSPDPAQRATWFEARMAAWDAIWERRWAAEDWLLRVAHAWQGRRASRGEA